MEHLTQPEVGLSLPLSSKTTALALPQLSESQSNVLARKDDGSIKTSSPQGLSPASTHGATKDSAAIVSCGNFTLATSNLASVNDLLSVDWLKPVWPKASNFNSSAARARMEGD